MSKNPLGIDFSLLGSSSGNPLRVLLATETQLPNLVQQWTSSPFVGAEVLHFIASHSDSFTERDQPDYLAQDPGQWATGVKYTPNPNNPLRGVICPAKRVAVQDKGGIYFQSQCQLYLSVDPGEVYALSGDRPKRQDRFDVNNLTYYAAGPAFPCQQGQAIAAWQISLTLERYTVKNS